MAYTLLSELKKHLNIESAFTDDDLYLSTLIDVAELSVNEYCNDGLVNYDNTTIPITVKQATLLLAGHLYITRTIVSYAQGIEIPYSFKFLLNPYKVFTVS